MRGGEGYRYLYVLTFALLFFFYLFFPFSLVDLRDDLRVGVLTYHGAHNKVQLLRKSWMKDYLLGESVFVISGISSPSSLLLPSTHSLILLSFSPRFLPLIFLFLSFVVTSWSTWCSNPSVVVNEVHGYLIGKHFRHLFLFLFSFLLSSLFPFLSFFLSFFLLTILWSTRRKSYWSSCFHNLHPSFLSSLSFFFSLSPLSPLSPLSLSSLSLLSPFLPSFSPYPLPIFNAMIIDKEELENSIIDSGCSDRLAGLSCKTIFLFKTLYERDPNAKWYLRYAKREESEEKRREEKIR